MDADTISKMTRQQRLQAMESLWDALVHETVEPVSPDWHQAVLARRLGNIAEGNADYVSLEELKASRIILSSLHRRCSGAGGLQKAAEELRFVKAVARGLMDAREGNTLSLDEARKALGIE